MSEVRASGHGRVKEGYSMEGCSRDAAYIQDKGPSRRLDVAGEVEGDSIVWPYTLY